MNKSVRKECDEHSLKGNVVIKTNEIITDSKKISSFYNQKRANKEELSDDEVIDDKFLDDKVVANSLIIPILAYLAGFSFVSLFLILFYAFGYLWLINHLGFSDEEVKHKKHSYISILAGVYLPAILFFVLENNF